MIDVAYDKSVVWDIAAALLLCMQLSINEKSVNIICAHIVQSGLL